MKLYTIPNRKMNVIVACAPFTSVFPFAPNLLDSAATIASSTASASAPRYSRGRRLMRSVTSAPVNAPKQERMLFAKL